MKTATLLAIALTALLTTSARADPTFDPNGTLISSGAVDTRTAPDQALYEKQQRAQGAISNLTAQTLLYQEGVFVKIEQNQQAEEARRAASQRPDGLTLQQASGSGASAMHNELAEKAGIEYAQDAAGSRSSSKRESRNATREAILRQEAAGLSAPALPTEVNINVQASQKPVHCVHGTHSSTCY